MRILITSIVLWAILLGFFATGVKVMATSPSLQSVQPATETVRDDIHAVTNTQPPSTEKFIPVEDETVR